MVEKLKVAATMLSEIIVHPLSTSVIHVKGGTITVERYSRQKPHGIGQHRNT